MISPGERALGKPWRVILDVPIHRAHLADACGTVSLDEQLSFEGFTIKNCPFHSTVHILIDERADPRLVIPPNRSFKAPWGTIIHELGHICVHGHTAGYEPDFLGWEYAMARKLRRVKEWRKFMYDYNLSGQEFGLRTPRQQNELLRRYLEEAVKKRYVVDGLPQRVAPKFDVPSYQPLVAVTA